MSNDDETGRDFHARLRHLRIVTAPGGKPLTTRALAEKVTEAGYKISHTYISRLLNGEFDDPSVNLVKALAKVFGVPAAYLLDADDERTRAEVEADLELLVAIKEGGVGPIAVNARGLSPGSQEAVLNVIKQWRLLEGLTMSSEGPNPEERDGAR